MSSMQSETRVARALERIEARLGEIADNLNKLSKQLDAMTGTVGEYSPRKALRVTGVIGVES